MGRRLRDVRLPAPALAFVVLFGLALTWAAATPMFGVPDEIAHMIRSAGAVRGDLDGRPLGDGTTRRTYLAPATMLPGGEIVPTSATGTIYPEDLLHPCYAFRSTQGAECLSITSDEGDVRLYSSATGYPPLYYFVVGWPTRILGGLPALYAMRAVSAAIFAGLLTVAVTSISRGRRWAAQHVGFGLALTPMVWFMGASVNPTSMAVAAGVAAWCGGLRLVSAGDEERLGRLAWRFGLPLCLLLLTRRDSLLWGGLVVVFLASMIEPVHVRRLVRSPHVLGWAAASSLCAAYSARVTLGTASDLAGAEVASGSARGAFGSMSFYLEQMIGVFGWLDTRLPAFAYQASLITIGGIVLGAISLANRRRALVVVGLLVSLIAAIVAVGAGRWPYFQGRYALPFAVGIPIVAGFALAVDRGHVRAPRRPVILAVGLAAAVHTLAFYQQLRRYSISGRTTWWLLDAPTWRPPTAPLLALVLVNAVLVIVAAIAWLLRGTTDEQEPG